MERVFFTYGYKCFIYSNILTNVTMFESDLCPESIPVYTIKKDEICVVTRMTRKELIYYPEVQKWIDDNPQEFV